MNTYLFCGCCRDEYVNGAGKDAWKQAGVSNKIGMFCCIFAMRGVAYLFFSHADLRLGDATQIMPDMLNKEGEGSYDFVFIDADKENYDIYYEKGLQLIRKGGVIIVDNTLWQGYVADPEIKEDATTVAIRKLNDKVSFSSLLSNIQ